jgi:hypothetical protein
MNSNVPVPVPAVRDAVAVSPFLFLLADGTVRTIESPGSPVPGVARAVAVASDHVNRYALLEDGRRSGRPRARDFQRRFSRPRPQGRLSSGISRSLSI